MKHFDISFNGEKYGETGYRTITGSNILEALQSFLADSLLCDELGASITPDDIYEIIEVINE